MQEYRLNQTFCFTSLQIGSTVFSISE